MAGNRHPVLDLADHLWRGGPYSNFWSISADGKVKETLWFPTSKIVSPNGAWGERHQYLSVHPSTVVGASNERTKSATVASINCFPADFDAKDEVLPSEYGTFLSDDFATLNPGAQKAAIKKAQEQAMMLDLAKYKARALSRVRACPIPPTWIVDSGGGYQCYWLLRDTVMLNDSNRERIEAIQAEWVLQIGSDPGVKDLARVLRLIGSANVKEYFAPNYPVVTVFERNDSLLYDLADFERITGIDDVWAAAQNAEKPRPHGTSDPVITKFNDTVKVGELLEKHDYKLGKKLKGVQRYSRPGRDEGQTSVVVWEAENRSYHHSSSDALYCNGHSRDAFDVFTSLVHHGDTKAAYIDAKKSLGLWEEQAKATRRTVDDDGVITYVDEEEPPWMALEQMADAQDSTSESSEVDEHHPLNIQPNADLQLGWIDDYADFMTKLTVSPREFNVLAGLILVATVIQRRAKLRMSFGDIYPNIYGTIVARSSVYHKSSATAKTRQMLQRAMLDNLLLSELMTSEGLLKQMQDKPSGLVIRDEIGTLFASHNVKYLANLKPDLTALYDCHPYSRRLSNEEIKLAAPYLCILGATTPARFFESVTFTDWQDGFLARWLIVMPEQEPDFDAMIGLFTSDHDARMGQLAIKLMELDKEPARDFTLMDDAFAAWDKWQRSAAKEAYYFGDDITAAIVTRYAAYALKFAIILAAVNGKWGVVTKTIMETAIALADNYKATVYKLLKEKANYGVSGAKLQKVFRAIKHKAGTTGITAREIGQLCHMKKGELTPCLEKLISIGGVITISGGKAERYIPAVENLPAKTW